MAERGVEGVLETLEQAGRLPEPPPPMPPYALRVSRDRHAQQIGRGFLPGHFQALLQQRIPFPWRDGSPRTGVLIEVNETETHIELWFADVRPDDEED